MNKRKIFSFGKISKMLPLVIVILSSQAIFPPSLSLLTELHSIKSYGTINYSSGGRLYIEGKYIKKDGEIVHLAGATFGPVWNVENGIPESNRQAREDMVRNMGESGANFLYISVNLMLWSDPNYDNEQYKRNVDTWVEWAIKYKMFFAIKVHCSRYEKIDLFSNAGSNWKIAEYEPWRSRAIEMFVEMAEKYKHLPNFVGISLLNEPWREETYEKWDVVTQFYLDSIDAVREVDPNCIFFVMAPYLFSSYVSHWEVKGFLPREGVVLEYHHYYHNRLNREWGVVYVEQGPEEGRKALEQWLLDNVIRIYDMGYPVFCGEFGVWSLYGEYDPYWKEQHTDHMQLFNKYSIHYAQFRFFDDLNAINGTHQYAVCTNDGRELNERGQSWAMNVPISLIRP